MRIRLVGTYVAVIIMTLALLIVYVTATVSEYTHKNRRMEMLTKANIAANFIAEYAATDPQRYMKIQAEQLGLGQNSRIIVTDKEARVTSDSNETGSLRGKALLDSPVVSALRGENYSATYKGEGNVLISHVAVPIVRDKDITGTIYILSNVDDINDYIGDVLSSLILIAIVISVLVGLVGFMFANLILNPVKNITEKMKLMAEGKLKQNIEAAGHDEISAMVNSFNKMSGQLNDIEKKRREFVSNASHELKTPLSSIKLISDSLLQANDIDLETVKEFLEDINDEVDRLTRIIDKMLTLTKMDALTETKQTMLKEGNIRPLIANILKSLSPLANKKNITMDYFSTADVFLPIDADRLWEAVYNIIDNSIKYTPEGGRISVELHRDVDVIIVISDTGVGIAQDEIHKIFDRFYRIDPARSRETGGTGLGLAIALDAVELHGGYIEVESDEQKGSVFKLIFPAKKG